jgi:hypothetical protein
VPIKGNPLGIPKGGVRLRLDDEEPYGYTVEGTSFPMTPKVGWRCFRTDIRGGMWFRWSGVYWLTEELFLVERNVEATTASGGALVARGNWSSDLQTYVQRIDVSLYPTATNNGSVYRHFYLRNDAGTVEVIGFATAHLTENSWQFYGPMSLAVPLVPVGTKGWGLTAQTSGSPGPTYLQMQMWFRLRGP